MERRRLVILEDADGAVQLGTPPGGTLEDAEAMLLRALARTQREILVRTLKRELTGGVQLASSMPGV